MLKKQDERNGNVKHVINADNETQGENKTLEDEQERQRGKSE